MFEFLDRRGNRVAFSFSPGETVEEVLLRNRIPPASVIVLKDEEPVGDTCLISESSHYLASLIEGYDIESIREHIENLQRPLQQDSSVYVKRRLSFTDEGDFRMEAVHLDPESLMALVEDTIADTCREFELFGKNKKRIVLGFSGGVDSTALMLGLNSVRGAFPGLDLLAVTFEDCDAEESPTFDCVRDLPGELGIEHRMAPASLAEDVFHLTEPLQRILPKLMKTEHAHHVMYIDHHTTRRVLEVFSENEGYDHIALGLHATDLAGGLMNAWMTGYEVAKLPKRQIGSFTYVFPLAFLLKKELHLYHYFRTGKLANHSFPNQWETNPLDRNFYYYLSDMFQSHWPGFETMLFTAHNLRFPRSESLSCTFCGNCGAAILHQPFSAVAGDECDVCSVLRQAGYVK